jgi:hypothetical protein
MLVFVRFGIPLFVATLLAASTDALPDFVLQTSSGPISFHDVRVTAGSGHISGIVTNLGEHKWSGLLADFELVDPVGKTVGRAPLMFKNLDRKQSRRFEDRVEFADGKQKEFSGHRVVYRTGAIDVKYVLKMVSPAENRLLEFADQDLEFSFSVSETALEVKIANRSRAAVKVIWRDTEFRDVFEQTQLIAHVGGGDSTITPSGLLKETIEPVGGNTTTDYEGWRAGRVLPRTQDAGEMTGRSIALSLPVEVEGVRRSYRFAFQIAETLF